MGGGGIDVERIRAKIRERGLLGAEAVEQLSDGQALDYIWHPGFSTAQAVTDISGRGVGMDVVRTNIERIGGTVDMQSPPNGGTMLKVKIPLTLAIIFLLLYVHFRNIAESLIVMLTLPFALVGGVWFLWGLDYNTSVAVWVGFIALAGVAAETGVVMLIYLDEA